jgi:hypothetical protein
LRFICIDVNAQSMQRDIVAAASASLPRVHVVVNQQPRKGALEACTNAVFFMILF